MDELTADAAIILGGWDARCAVTLAVASAGDVAARHDSADGRRSPPESRGFQDHPIHPQIGMSGQGSRSTEA
ncbi:hypothetical protein M6D93_04095 [Jatrophihabitans telluris]|uniref:Uncharacterized protein n=1 Tax=Jatrophihabitans telluris TaxID=2038343 RepID=A0ABY4R227_9ACTN|nr:hypothetical protein [Jatrophihabitans telluris]UQX89190.1 hypothetical protein M6D93_04095 [Jatrophihabitans telluris]